MSITTNNAMLSSIRNMRFLRKCGIWYALFLVGTFTLFLFVVFESESIMLSRKNGSETERYNDTFDEMISIVSRYIQTLSESGVLKEHPESSDGESTYQRCMDDYYQSLGPAWQIFGRKFKMGK